MTGLDRVAVWVVAPTPVTTRRLEDRVRRRGFGRIARRQRSGFRVDGVPTVLPPRDVRTEPELLRALKATAPGEVLLVRWTGDRVIPLENAVAASTGRHLLGVLAERPQEVPAALGALERGADLVIVRIRDEAELLQLEQLVERPDRTPLDWRTAVVDRVEPVGVSERVLVDTTRLLDPRAGLLVGSSARFLFSVVSEAEGSDFSRPRPFRVNAGSPHSYVLMADGTTRYLSELVAGDRVRIARPGAPSESARVGRLKIERRPMVLVDAQIGAHRATIFLQEAETVRLSGARGSIAVTELLRGQRVRGVRLPPARHLGTVVQEGVQER